MRPTAIRPTGKERTFGSDELIVSKTDPRGHITYANDVFLRLAGYPEEAVLGQPHSMIRHPDMPRCVFGLLWEHLKAGREVFAYINNMAVNGDHYWVYAHVTPSRTEDGTVVGYHSNRRVPDRGALQRIEPLYRALVATERRHERPTDAIAASTAELDQYLQDQGADYDEHVWTLAGARS